MTMATFREESAMSDLPTGHMRNQHEYSYRLPTPPRIVVPPPTLTTDMPGLTLGGHAGDEVDMRFLEELDLEDIVQKNTLLEWAYERRRQAQMILPWLYLGPMVAAKDKAFLHREGITMVLAIRAQPNSLRGAMEAASQVCLQVASIEAPNFYALTPKFPEAASIINSHVAGVRQHTLQSTGQASLGKVLVFCESGNEKSAAVVASYLMDTLNNIDHIKAMQICQAQRFCVNFDDVLKNILRSYWDIIGARRAIAASKLQPPQQNGLSNGDAQTGWLQPPLSSSKPKRRIEHLQDDDMDMDDDMDASDALRFAHRDVTPFQDLYVLDMPYSLRPESSLKLPERYRQVDDEEDNHPPNPRPADNGTAIHTQESLLAGPEDLTSFANIYPPPRPSSLTAQHPHFFQPARTDFVSTTNFTTPTNASSHRQPPERLNMANIKIVRAAPRRSEGEDRHHHELSSRSRSGRATKASQRNIAPPTPTIPKPAAFPSLPTNVPPSPQAHHQNPGHGMKELFEAMEDDDEERVTATKQYVDRMYQADTSECYQIKFESLWRSLRQTIIEEIQTDFPEATYKTPFYPAQRILNLSTEQLVTIMSGNAQVWETDDDIPAWYREQKRKHPTVIIDPDEPPPAEVVKAIRFLKQQSLPGSLLGEWHALPPIECPTQQWHTMYAQKEAERVRQQASAEIEAVKQRDLLLPSQPPPPPMDARTAIEYEKWRTGYYYRLQIPRPRTREEYIEQEHAANQRTPFMKANYFDMYESIQREESLDIYPVDAWTKMAELHEKDLQRRRAAAAAEGVRKRAEELVWPNTPFLVDREVKSRGVKKELQKQREEKEEQQQQQQEKAEQLRTKDQTREPKEKQQQPIKNAKKAQATPTTTTTTTTAQPIAPPSKAPGKKRGPDKKRDRKPQDDKAPKLVVSKSGEGGESGGGAKEA
ncbi:FMI2 protein [Stemphylium lycopersici]|nr:FMI2 protein [Stemphylium lycopersici]